MFEMYAEGTISLIKNYFLNKQFVQIKMIEYVL
jgi:hypothetical protein